MRKAIGALSILIVGLGLAVPLEAQGRRGPSLDEQMADLDEQLEFTDEQAVEVRKILEEQGARRREMFQAAGGDRSAMRETMMELQEETNALLAEVLDEDQMTKYGEIMAERRQRRGPPPF